MNDLASLRWRVADVVGNFIGFGPHWDFLGAEMKCSCPSKRPVSDSFGFGMGFESRCRNGLLPRDFSSHTTDEDFYVFLKINKVLFAGQCAVARQHGMNRTIFRDPFFIGNNEIHSSTIFTCPPFNRFAAVCFTHGPASRDVPCVFEDAHERGTSVESLRNQPCPRSERPEKRTL